MHPRAEGLIASLGLTPHPEGGYYREIFRSSLPVSVHTDADPREALTVVHFLLPDGSISRLHRVAADEVWCFAEGDPVALTVVSPDGGTLREHILGPLSGSATPVCIVRNGWWQGARPLGAFALVSCTVAPGFRFKDFQMLADLPAEADRLSRQYPSLRPLL